jgi:DnaJ-class molecular chaperone
MAWIVYGALAYLVYKAVAGEDDAKPKKRKKRRIGRPPHEVLGVAADATPQEIRRAYQKKVQVYHPDKVAGAADELQALAEKRTKELNAAYEAMMRRAGAR